MRQSAGIHASVLSDRTARLDHFLPRESDIVPVPFFFSSRRRDTSWTGDWSSDVCSSDLRRERRPDHDRQGRADVARPPEADLVVRSAAVALAALALAAVPSATARHADTPGVTDTTVKIGGTVPLSGPAAAFGVVGPGAAAYFAYVNDRGGVNGRKIQYEYLDDGYNPTQTVQLTRQLVQQDDVFAIFNTIGTDNALAVRP